MNLDRLKHLLSKYLNNSIDKDELTELFLLMKTVDEGLLNSLVDDTLAKDTFILENLKEKFNKERVFESTKRAISKKELKSHRKSIPKKWLTIAASVIATLTVGILWNNVYIHDKYTIATHSNDIMLPDYNQAVISMEDGRAYNLLHTSEKILEKEGIEQIELSSGELAFKIKSRGGPITERRTFHSPKGSSSSLILADGTKIWLNSGSSLTYPTQFDTDSRRVSIDGEAYFEVAHDLKTPFIVLAENTQIKVLGTEFNIATNIKSDDIFTTLVSGSVEVNTNNKNIILAPGMQSASNKSSGSLKSYAVDVRQVLAWKEGYFRFHDDDIETVLDKIKTWYNIDEYDIQHHTTDRFSGSVLRTRKLSELLSQLEKISNYKFIIQDGRVQVMK